MLGIILDTGRDTEVKKKKKEKQSLALRTYILMKI